MRRLLVLGGILLFLAAIGAAETEQLDDDVDPRPGLITADSSLWTLDVAMDNALVAVGLRSTGEVVHKRASEAVVAAEANDTAAIERAVEEAHKTARTAHSGSGDGLEHAEHLLLEVRDRSSEDAHDGIDHALSEVMQAQERSPLDVVDRDRSLPNDLDDREAPDHIPETAGGGR